MATRSSRKDRVIFVCLNLSYHRICDTEMSFPLGSLPLINGTKTSFNTPFTGLKGLIIGNESGLDCDIVMGPSGVRKKLYPGTVDFFEVRLGYQGVVLVSPTLGIASGILYPSSFLTFDMVGLNENIDTSVYPMSLGRQMQAGLTSPQSGYSSGDIFLVALNPTNRYLLNIFNNNAANSGVIARIFAAQIRHNCTGTCSVNLSVRTDGVDNNFAVNLPIFRHNIGGPASLMHVTEGNNVAIPGANTFVFSSIVDDNLYDFLVPPDAFYLNPRQNLTMDIQTPCVGALVYMMFKWSDQ